MPARSVTLTLNLSEAVTVAGGTPTLTLNDGGTATYSGGSGTNALTFSYTVAAGQNTAALAATAVNLNWRHRHGRRRQCRQSVALRPDPDRPADRHHDAGDQPRLSESPASGDLNAGKTVTLTLNLSEAVTVAGGTPTLTLNDGGTATYTGGSGTSALTFSYTVAAGQNTADAGGDRGQPQRRHHHRRRRQCRQSVAERPDPGRPADRHHRADGDVGCGVAVERHRRCRQDRHPDAQPERGGDGSRRHPDADAQRRRHRHLYRRLGHQRADLQLHGWRWPDSSVSALAIDRGQSQRRNASQDGAGNAANLAGRGD